MAHYTRYSPIAVGNGAGSTAGSTLIRGPLLAVAPQIHKAFERGDLTPLDEITVICVGANASTDYGCNLIVASGTTKKGETAQDIIPTFELVIAELISDEVYTTKGPTSDIQAAAITCRATFNIRCCYPE